MNVFKSNQVNFTRIAQIHKSKVVTFTIPATPSTIRPDFIQILYILVALSYDDLLPDCSCQSLDRGPRQRSMWLEKAELGQRLVLWGVGEELVQEEGLLTSQHEHRLSETGPSSTDLHIHATLTVTHTVSLPRTTKMLPTQLPPCMNTSESVSQSLTH